MRSIITETDPNVTTSGDGTLQEQVVKELRREIENGMWPAGAKLPSMNVLCGRYRVSNITVRGALRELAQCGLVESRPRSGVFVKNKSADAVPPGNRNIGLILTGFRHSFYADIIMGAQTVCAAHGYEVSIATSDDNPSIESEQMARLAPRCAGLLITPSTVEAHMPSYRSLQDQGVPFVQLVRYVPGLAAPAISADNRMGGYLATRHLCEVGCERIYLLSDYDDTAARERREGYEAALQDTNLPPCEVLHEQARSEHGEAVGYRLMKRALKIHSSRGGVGRIGIFALNLQLARGSYLALQEAKLKVPADAAVVGFDDFGAQFFEPPLTAVRQNILGMGRDGAELLLAMVAGRVPKEEASSLRLEPELIVRNSTDIKSAYCLKQRGPLAPLRAGSGRREREIVGAVS